MTHSNDPLTYLIDWSPTMLAEGSLVVEMFEARGTVQFNTLITLLKFDKMRKNSSRIHGNNQTFL